MNPIFWHQGLFLTPQHFQLTDAHNAEMARPLLNTVLPFSWGIRHIEIQPNALSRGTVHIDSLSMVLQDGSFVQFPGNAVIRARSFEKDWTYRDRPLTIYAGIRRFGEQGKNVTVVPNLDSEGDTRFLSLADPGEVNDLYAEGPSASVKTLYFNVRLFWDSEIANLEHYNLIPVAQVLWEGGVIKASTSFIPPSLSLSSSRNLSSLVQEIRNECASRSRQLEEFKTPRDQKTEGMDAGYLITILALHTLNRYVPLLYHYAESEPVHPWFLYGTLRQMVGEVSTFSDRVNVLGESDLSGEPLPPYDHQDIWGCLTKAQTVLFTLLNNLTVGPDLIIRLEKSDESYNGLLSLSFFSPRTRYYLVVKTEGDTEDASASFLDNAKVGPPSVMSSLIRRALPGVALTAMSGPPQGLPRRMNAQYFRIEPHDPVWDAIRQEESIQVYWPSAPEGSMIDLIGVR
ncbi:MAG: type VI secretion system baseplate subunit TssK [Leptospirillum sp.]|jgi:type VI secretion system protein ImpJ